MCFGHDTLTETISVRNFVITVITDYFWYFVGSSGDESKKWKGCSAGRFVSLVRQEISDFIHFSPTFFPKSGTRCIRLNQTSIRCKSVMDVESSSEILME